MKRLRYLIIHCTATPEGMSVDADMIRRWHLSPPPSGRGWRRVGYSDMILLDGRVVNLVEYDDNDYVEPWEITNGAAGVNDASRHVVYAGGCQSDMRPKDTRTAAQRATMIRYVFDCVRKHPDILVAGHNQFAAKACPSFNVPEWLRSIHIPERNRYCG